MTNQTDRDTITIRRADLAAEARQLAEALDQPYAAVEAALWPGSVGPRRY